MAELRKPQMQVQTSRSESVSNLRRQPRSRSIGAATARVRPVIPSQDTATTNDTVQDPNASSIYGDRLSEKLTQFNKAKTVGESICICKAAKYMERQRIHLQNEEIKLQELKIRVREFDEELRSRQNTLIEQESDLRRKQEDIFEREECISEREAQTRTMKQKLTIEKEEFESQVVDIRPKLATLDRREKDINIREKDIIRREEALLENHQAITAHEEKILADKEKLETRMQRLIAKEKEIDEMHAMLQKRDSALAEHERTMHSQEAAMEQQKRIVSDQDKANKSDRATIERLVELNQTMKYEIQQKEQQLELKESELSDKSRYLDKELRNLNLENERLQKLAVELGKKEQKVNDTNELVKKNEDLLDRCHEMEMELDMRRAAIDAQEQAFANKRMICESDWDEMEKNIKALQTKLKDKERQLKEKESEVRRQQELLQKAQNEFNRLLPDHNVKLGLSVSMEETSTTNKKKRSQTPTETQSSAVNRYLQHMQYNAPAGGLLTDRKTAALLGCGNVAGFVAALNDPRRNTISEKSLNGKGTLKNIVQFPSLENRPRSVSLRGFGGRQRTASCPPSPEKIEQKPSPRNNLAGPLASVFDGRDGFSMEEPVERPNTEVRGMTKKDLDGLTPPSVCKRSLKQDNVLKDHTNDMNIPSKTPLSTKNKALATKTPAKTPKDLSDDLCTTNNKNRRLSVGSPFDWQLSPSPVVGRNGTWQGNENIPPNENPITPATNTRKDSGNKTGGPDTSHSLTLSPDEEMDEQRKIRFDNNCFMTNRGLGMDLGVQPKYQFNKGHGRKGLFFDGEEDSRRPKTTILSPDAKTDSLKTPVQKRGDDSSIYAESPLFTEEGGVSVM